MLSVGSGLGGVNLHSGEKYGAGMLMLDEEFVGFLCGGGRGRGGQRSEGGSQRPATRWRGWKSSNDWKTGVEKVPMIGTFGGWFFQ